MDMGLLGFAAALGLAAVGSAAGIGVAGMAAIGAWKKCYAQNRNAPFLLVAFVAAPLTQTIYGFILMMTLTRATVTPSAAQLGIGLFGGAAIGTSAFFQGKIAAASSDAFAETSKGFGQYVIALGLIESVALFTMVFLLAFIK